MSILWCLVAWYVGQLDFPMIKCPSPTIRESSDIWLQLIVKTMRKTILICFSPTYLAIGYWYSKMMIAIWFPLHFAQLFTVVWPGLNLSFPYSSLCWNWSPSSVIFAAVWIAAVYFVPNVTNEGSYLLNNLDMLYIFDFLLPFIGASLLKFGDWIIKLECQFIHYFSVILFHSICRTMAPS